MFRGLWKLTWLEIKIFLREPMGAVGTILIPVLVFVVVGRLTGGRLPAASVAATGFLRVGLPVFASILIALSGVLSLVTIISIYREGGILRRLRATPLRPQTILTAHVLVKLALTLATMALMVVAGEAVLSDQLGRSCVWIRHGAADQHLEHPLDWLFDREHCADGALCATDRGSDSVSDARILRAVRSSGLVAANAPPSGAPAATDLRGIATSRGYGRARRGRRIWAMLRGAGPGVRNLHGAFGEGVSMGVRGVPC